MKKLSVLIIFILLCSCSEVKTTEQLPPDDSITPTDNLTLDKAFEIVRTSTNPEGKYIPIQGLDAEVYTISYLGGTQFSYVVLYYDNSIKSESYYYFILSSVVLDTQTTFAPQQVYNRYAVDKNTGRLFIKLMENGEINGDVNPEYPDP